MPELILFLDTVHPVLAEKLTENGFICEEDLTCTRKELLQKLDRYSGLVLRSRLTVDKQILEKAKGLKFIARSGSGLENIDVTTAKKFGIHCLNSPEGNANAVGEHALGMLLTLFHRINRSDREVRKGIWKREENRGIELQEKTVGIIGYGHTGSAFARKLSGMGCRVLAYDKNKTGFGSELAEEVTFNELTKLSDIISLHINYTTDNLYFMNSELIKKFGKPFYLINTSRGKVLNTEDVVYAMKKGRIQGLCLDVYEYEMSSFESLETNEASASLEFLKKSNDVVLTPHIAGWTDESYIKLSSILAEKIMQVYRQ